MVLKLDPHVPLVWRTPDSLQLGVDRPVTVIDNVRLSEQRMIAALVSGTSRSGLVMTGIAFGASEADIATLLDRLGPVLTDTESVLTDTESRARARASAQGVVAIDGAGATAHRLAEIIREAGYEPCRWPLADQNRTVALAVIVSHFVIAPERYGVWLRRDIPHLPIVFGDEWVSIGPLVEPGIGPCLFCIEKARVDLDPAWPAIASQLLGRTAWTEQPLVVAEAAASAGRIVCNALGGIPATFPATSLRLDAVTGQVSAVQHQQHVGCGCRVLPENVTLLEPVRAAARSATTTSAIVDGPW